MRSTAPATVALTALLAAGCGQDGPDDSAGAPTPTQVGPTATTPSPTAVRWATCVSTRSDLRVRYPQHWTARDYPGHGCAYFDPQPFEVERGTEAPSVAIRLDVENVAYARVRDGYLRGDVIAQEAARVAGHEGIRIEDRDTDGPLAPKGHRVTYLADLGTEKTLVLTTNETDAEDFGRAQDVVDAMADRLQPVG